MAYPVVRAACVAGTALAAFAPVDAQAGGFAVREHSAVGAGMAYAGEGTSRLGLGAMFWNPAAATQTRGLETETTLTGIMPRSVIDTLPGTSPPLAGLGAGSADLGKDALLSSMAAGYRYSPNLFLGFLSGTPYGLGSAAPAPWPGQNLSLNAEAKSIEGNAIVGFKINDAISVGAGLRVMWAKAQFSRALLPLPTAPSVASLDATDIGIGWSAGVTVKPWDGTELALGYRSRIKLTLDGETLLPPVAPLTGVFGITGDVTLPDQVHFGVSQRVNGAFTLLGTAEWQNWSVLQPLAFTFKSGPAVGAVATTLRFNYRDTWYFAGGGEYQLSPQTVLRAGIGFETGSVTDAARATAVPSNDGWRFSAGATHHVTPALTLDIGASYYVQDEAPIRVVPGHPDSGNLLFPPPIGQLSYIGVGRMDLWAMTVGMRYRFGSEAAARR